ncbi:MAG TPA: FG-GAP-like repeat-containing protein [Bryobacteraceae bacterium]|nr:FG-GAP-like repeat-containing protein [Bryobacteraceae bacterium]
MPASPEDGGVLPAIALMLAAGACAFLLLRAADPEPSLQERLARHRNLGKAFYENPTTQTQAVEQFVAALKLAPNSARERLNYGLALLRAGRTAEGIAELERVQKQDPGLPHTWFNLGIQFKKLGEQDRALQQFRRMVELVPDEPISHYNLAALYKLAGDNQAAIRHFQLAAKLDPNLAAPHFQLYNLFRLSSRSDEAKRELETFQRLRKQHEGAAIPEDVEWSSWAEIYDVMADAPPATPPAELRFTTVARAVPAGVWADVDNDGKPEQLTLDARGATLNGKLLAGRRFNKAIWLDYDHDYDLDLLLLGASSVLLRNQGTAGFADRTADFPFADAEAVDAVAFRAVADTKGTDLLVSFRGRPGVLYRDRLAGTYEPTPSPLPPAAHQLRAADVNNDGWIDIVCADGEKLALLHNKRGTLVAGNIAGAAASGDIVLADLENRGFEDIVTGGVVLRNAGGGRFTTALQRPFPICGAGRAADVNGDGRTDIQCDDRTFLNQTNTANNWIAVRLEGVKNLKLTPGAEVEVKAGARYQKKIYAGEPLVFGLGREKIADTVRITWPNGLIQNEIKQPAGKMYTYREAQRLSGSCPIVWSWNGRKFEYITDVLGVAPLGASAGDGQFFPLDHDEYIQIPGESLAMENGHYEIRITEELAEVAYLDQVRLIAVDHPSATSVYTNDKFKAPPFPEFRLFGVSRRIPPRAAREGNGSGALDLVLRRDRRYPDGFRRNLGGVAELHSLELDFGSGLPADSNSVLILNGWVDWADGSTFRAVAQENPRGLITPYLQLKDKGGQWRTVIEDMGMPAGKPKTIAVDLTGKWLSDSREVRIVTNLCVYWDEIFLGDSSARPPARLTAAPLLASDLRFRGFSPVAVHPQRRQPEYFVYAGAQPSSMWNPTPGLYTRYGDVRELTAAVDDKLIVMGSGDELRLIFDASSLPPLPAGWKRDFLLFADGWAKDRDANTACSQHTEPLPFHAMSRFPYPANEKFPDTAEHRRIREQYLTRPALQLIRPLRSAAFTSPE